MTRTRARADERNEKTDSVTRERWRIRNLEMEVTELRVWKAERLQNEEDTEDERERLAGLLSTVADDMEARGLNIEIGEGLSRVIITAADVHSAAELLDPDD